MYIGPFDGLSGQSEDLLKGRTGTSATCGEAYGGTPYIIRSKSSLSTFSLHT